MFDEVFEGQAWYLDDPKAASATDFAAFHQMCADGRAATLIRNVDLDGRLDGGCNGGGLSNFDFSGEAIPRDVPVQQVRYLGNRLHGDVGTTGGKAAQDREQANIGADFHDALGR